MPIIMMSIPVTKTVYCIILNSFLLYNKLKGQCHEIFDPLFFHPPMTPAKPEM
jgi:hypothetical protein